MSVLFKMTVQEVTQHGGEAIVPLCVAYESAQSWPPTSTSTLQVHKHDIGECEKCTELLKDMGLKEMVTTTISGLTMESVKLTAFKELSNDNIDWAAATPFAEFQASITNPSAFGSFIPGETYLVEARRHMPARRPNKYKSDESSSDTGTGNYESLSQETEVDERLKRMLQEGDIE